MKPHFTILICSRNDSVAQVQRSLQVALSQDYDSFRVKWRDDCSDLPDARAAAFLLDDDRLDATGSERREYAMKHYVELIREAETEHPGTIILCHGGDDCLAGPHALARIAKEYESGAWFTYGQYRQFPSNKVGRCVPIPPEVLTERRVRSHPFVTMHPTTFYAKLFLKIREEDLKINGRWIDTAADTHYHFPILEMCGKPERVRLIEEILYYYQEADPKRFVAEEYALQCFMHWNSRHLPRYKTLETLDSEAEIEPGDSSDWGLICESKKKIYDAKLARVEGEPAVSPDPLTVPSEVPTDGTGGSQ